MVNVSAVHRGIWAAKGSRAWMFFVQVHLDEAVHVAWGFGEKIESNLYLRHPCRMVAEEFTTVLHHGVINVMNYKYRRRIIY
jgi:hypothetical protein